jgi:prevent-host-death family protein
MSIVNTYEAKSQLSKLIDRAAAGEEIIIARAGKPVARLTAYTPPNHPRVGGQWSGRIQMAHDFDAPLPPEIMQAFTESSIFPDDPK